LLGWPGFLAPDGRALSGFCLAGRRGRGAPSGHWRLGAAN
jgi:hypothetical protein